MKLIDYIRLRKTTVIVLLILPLIYILIFSLYGFSAGVVLYPSLLGYFLAAAVCTTDYIKVKKRHLRYTEEAKKIRNSHQAPTLTATDNILENDCLELIDVLSASLLQKDNYCNDQLRDMTEYYSAWVHQIKTPISSMKLMLQNEDSDFSRELSPELLKIEQYVEMVLAFIRLGSESTDYVFREYDADMMLKQVLRKFAPDFINRKLSLNYKPVNIKIVTDGKWFMFLLEQILSNSLKYTKEGTICIYSPKENTICISDTGIGILPEDLPRIFEKGYTGYNGRTEKSSTGLGLYLSKRIANNLGIDLVVTSEVNVGTSVFLTISQEQNKKE